jgi:hypothetical protein
VRPIPVGFLALLAMASALMVGQACYRDRIRPVIPPPCLTELAPAPPDSEDDDAWEAYHADLEAWSAKVERACGPHLLPPTDEPSPGVYGG